MCFKQYLPMYLTLFRIVSSFIYIIFFSKNIFFSNELIVIWLVLLAVSDFFDGYCARKYHISSYMGSLLDPIADKLVFLSFALPLVKNNLIPPEVFFLIMVRDLAIGLLREYSQKKGFQITPHYIAKFKTAILFIILILSYIFSLYVKFINILWYVAAWFVLYSGMNYFYSCFFRKDI